MTPKLFMLSASLVKHEGITSTRSIMQGYRVGTSENEAKGGFVTAVEKEKPGFGIEQLLCMEVPQAAIDALRQSSPPTAGDGLDKDEQVAITEHLMMLADLDTEDAEHPPCTDFCGNRVCDQLGCVVSKYQRTHAIPTPTSETKAPGEER